MRPFMCLCFLKAQAHKKATANTGGTFFLAHAQRAALLLKKKKRHMSLKRRKYIFLLNFIL